MQEAILPEGSAKSSSDQSESVVPYLIAEFEVLNQRAMQYDQTAANKTSFFLAVVTAVIGGAVLLGQQNWPGTLFISTFCIILVFLLALGFTALSQILDLYAQSVFLLRRSGRIRRWFLDRDPLLRPYLPFVVSDDSPPYYIGRAGLRGAESVVLLVNSGVAGLLAGVLIILASLWSSSGTLSTLQWQSHLLAIMGSILAFTLGWRWQTEFIKRFLQRWEQREVTDGWVHFPADREV